MATLTTHTSKDPSSKHATTEYNRYKRVESRVTALVANAIAFRTSFDNYLKSASSIWESADYRKLSSYYKGKLSGISDTQFHQLYGCYGPHPPLLMSVSIGPDGRMFAEKDDSWLSESHEYKSSMQCRHIWREPFVNRGEVRFW